MRPTWLFALAASVPLAFASHEPSGLNRRGYDKPRKDGGCLRSCFNDKPECPHGMNPQQIGDCWTCCLHKDPDKGRPPPHNSSAPGAPGPDEQPGCIAHHAYCCTATGFAWCCDHDKGIAAYGCTVNWPWEWEGTCQQYHPWGDL
ncbi:hypothetical protein BDW74DRAFT_145233 [Aspergillus multicolor]|uniref:uncharacterized protein n=1 Tax=Aspergillus multicolor TaxID=41759 RepID=UPI003CCE2E53